MNWVVANKEKVALGFLFFTLVVCNILFTPTAGWARLFWNFLGYICLFVAYKIAQLSLSDIGLSRKYIKNGLKYAFIIILIILAVFLLAFFVDKQAFKDPRYNHSISTAFYAVFILLPLKTVLFEEFAFRGILPATLLKIKNNRWFATIISSLAFGLWHVASSVSIGNYHIGSIVIPKFIVVLIAVLFTALAGVFLCELRWRSKSLIAPILVHWFVNAAAIILAAISWR